MYNLFTAECLVRLAKLRELEKKARASLPVKSDFPSLISPLSPADFQEQLDILTAMGILDTNSPYLNPGTDAFARLFREKNWKNADDAMYFGDAKDVVDDFRLLATIMSGWEAFFNVSVHNRWGLRRDSNGYYLPNEALLKLEALTTQAIESGLLRRRGDKEVIFFFVKCLVL
jgi:hypothetical protein